MTGQAKRASAWARAADLPDVPNVNASNAVNARYQPYNMTLAHVQRVVESLSVGQPPTVSTLLSVSVTLLPAQELPCLSELRSPSPNPLRRGHGPLMRRVFRQTLLLSLPKTPRPSWLSRNLCPSLYLRYYGLRNHPMALLCSAQQKHRTLLRSLIR